VSVLTIYFMIRETAVGHLKRHVPNKVTTNIWGCLSCKK